MTIASTFVAGVPAAQAEAAPSIVRLDPASGSSFGGTAVAVVGTGLLGARAVHFGAAPAPGFRVVDDTRLVATSPAQPAGSVVHVTVVGADGRVSAATAATRFTHEVGRWSALQPVPTPLGSPQVTTLGDGRVLVTGPSDPLSRTRPVLYDPAANSGAGSAVLTDVATRGELSLTWLGASLPSSVLVAGGRSTPGSPVADAEVYDASEGSAVPVAGMHVPRHRHTATLLEDGTVLVVGGHGPGGAPLASAEIYDPHRRSWRQTSSAPRARAAHTATVLPDGKVLVVGGIGAGGAEATAELYVPGEDRFVPVPDAMDVARHEHTATLLAGGDVLVVGGSGTAAAHSAEVWDGSEGRFRAAAPMAVARRRHGAAGLGDGRVVVTGGVGSAADARSTEVYQPGAVDPATGVVGRWVPGAPMGRGRAHHAAVPVGTGRVLVVAGVLERERGDRASSTVEVFDASPTPPRPVVTAVEPITGSAVASTRVTVRGSGLFGVASVSFGGLAASAVSRVSDTELVVVAPPQPQGFVELRVTSAQGSAAAAFGYGAGGWAPTGALSRCAASSPSCAARVGHTATRLDAPACRDPVPPPWCGKVLVTGGGPVFHDGVAVRGSSRFTSATARFRPAEVGSAIVGDGIQPGTVIAEWHDERSVTLSAPAVSDEPGNGRFTAGGGAAQLYDPRAGSWSPTGSLAAERAFEPFAHRIVRLGLATATLLPDGRVLVAGGCCTSALTAVTEVTALDTAEIYDPGSGTWSPAGRMSTARMGHTATLLEGPACREPEPSRPPWCGKVLVAGGANNGDLYRVLFSAELFDPGTGTWSGAESLSMETARVGHTASLLANGTVLVTGGVGHTRKVCREGDPDCALVREEPLSSAEVFDPAMSGWQSTGPMDGPRFGHSATLLRPGDCRRCGMVIVAGGKSGADDNDQPVAARSTQAYDPATGQWVALGPLAAPRGFHTATLLADGTVLVAGGEGSGGASELYDPVADRWRPGAPMADGRALHSATVLDVACAPVCGRVLVAGGSVRGDAHTTVALASAELYTPGPRVASISPAAAPSAGGGMVSVSGANFERGATTVHFDGVPAGAVTVRSPTELSVEVPPHPPGEATVTVVTASGGSSATLDPDPAARFTFLASAAPGAVGDLAAEAVSRTGVALSFSAPPSDGPRPPPARRYVVKQATAPIVDDAGFASAGALCGGECSFVPGTVGERLTLTVGDLEPGTTYHYALRAVSEAGVAGPLSNPAATTTLGERAARCPAVRPGRGQVVHPGGYSLVGLPGGAAIGGRSTLYGWFDQGAGGRYSTQPATAPLSAGRGYWAWSACPRAVSLARSGTSTLALPLGAYRASMVANPWASGPVTVSGFDYAARWDPGLNGGAGGYSMSGFREAQRLGVGEGMWVFSFTNTTIRMAP